MIFNQKIASVGLTGYFGAIFLVAAPQLSVGLMVTYGLISTALGFGIAAISKAVGDEFPENGSTAAPRPSDNLPPYPGNDNSNASTAAYPQSRPIQEPVFIRPPMVHPRRPVTQPFFGNLFRKPPVHVIDHHIEASRAHPLPLPSAPPLPQTPIVSRDPFHKPAPQVVSHTIKAHQTPAFVPVSAPRAITMPYFTITPPTVTFSRSIPAAPIVSSDPSHKPAPKVVGRSIQPSR